MAQHTPGPWRIGDAGMTVFGPKTDQPAPVVIASLPEFTKRCLPMERKANARLIAAAPELLHALEELMQYVGGWDSPEGHPCNTAIKALKKAGSDLG